MSQSNLRVSVRSFLPLSRLLPLPILLALVPSGLPAAQLPQGDPEYLPPEVPSVTVGAPNLASFPGFAQWNANYGAVAAGDLDADRNAELAVIRNGKLVVFPDPAVLDDGVVVALNVTDVTYCESDGNGQAAFYFTSTRGLETVVQLVPGQYTVTGVSTDPLWSNARVRVGRAPYPVVVGSGSGNQVFESVWTAGVLSAPTVLYTPASPVLALELLNWDGDAQGIPEVALLLTTRLQVRPLTVGSGPLFSRASAYAGDAIAVLQRDDSPFDVLAWITHLPLPNEELGQGLLLLSPVFLAVNPLPYFGPFFLSEEFVALAAGDIAGEGRDSLLLTPTSGSRATLFKNVAESSSWLGPNQGSPLGQPTYLDLLAGTENVHGLVFADFFAQHDALGVAVESVAAVYPASSLVAVYPVIESWGKNLAQAMPSAFGATSFISAQSATGCLEICANGTPGNWTVQLGPGWGSTTGVNYVELIVRISVNSWAMNNVAFHHMLIPLDTLDVVDGFELSFDTRTSAQEFQDFDDCQMERLPASFFAMVRPVVSDGFDVFEAWPWAILGMSADCEGEHWLRTRAGASDCGFPIVADLCEETMECEETLTPPLFDQLDTCFVSYISQAQGSNYIPSAVPQSKIPGAGHLLPVVHPINY